MSNLSQNLIIESKMNFGVFLVICGTLVVVTECRLRFLSPFDNFCTGKEEGVYCRDCRKIVECGKGISFEMSCKDVDPSKEFCSENNPGKAFCGTTKTCLQETDSPAPRCKRVGRFPDPKHCEVYWECPKDEGENAEFYSCPPDTRFDPKREICTKVALAPLNGCTTYLVSAPNGLCKGKPFHSIPHPLRPDLYVRCDGKYQLEICGSNEFYDPKQNKCVFKCQEEGFFKNSDGTGFITCYKDGTKIVDYEQRCKKGKFLEKLGYCDNSSTEEETGENNGENNGSTTEATTKRNPEEMMGTQL